MPRVRSTPTRRRRRKKWLTLSKGYWGKRSILYRTAREAVMRAWASAYRDRRKKKRVMRKLWIMRINAKTREYGLSYSMFMQGLRRGGVNLNRKMLADMAINDEHSFKSLVETAKGSLNS